MNPATSILLIEDDPSIASSLINVLEGEGYRAILETSGTAGLRSASSPEVDVVLTDLRLPELNGLELLRELHRRRPHLPIVLMTAHGTTDTAIEATKHGAFEYLIKPFEIEELLQVIGKASEVSRMMKTVAMPGNPADASPAPTADALVGRGRAMQMIYKDIGRLAARPVSVLIRGETGTGKELVARAIWQHSERVAEPFVAINCTAIPEHLIESELFGHERGAFTGADSRRIGRFEQAHRGTLLLDEIGDLQPQVQVKLLRVLQEKAIQRVGGRESVPVDVRLIAATHRDLETMIRDGRFREDLYYRLNVMEITLPPLRDRREDIPDLVRFFLDKYTREFGLTTAPIQPEALEYLRGLPWPGNVRELENLVRKALLSSRGFPVSLDHVRQSIQSSEIPADAPERPLQAHVRARLEAAIRGEGSDVYASLLTELERELFLQTMEASAGNLAKAARWLGITRLTLREKLTRHGLRNASIPDDPPPQGPTITAA